MRMLWPSKCAICGPACVSFKAAGAPEDCWVPPHRDRRNHRRRRPDVLSLGFNITSRWRGKPLITLSCDAILFDMDGTLVDSTGCVKAIWGRWAEKHGIDLNFILQHSHGRRTSDTLNQIAPHLDVAAEGEALEAEEITIREGMVAVGGALQLLSGLKPHQWAVVTSAGR